MTPLAQAIAAEIRTSPCQFSEIVDRHRDVSWPDFLKAWGEIRSMPALGRDDDGNYVLEKE